MALMRFVLLGGCAVLGISVVSSVWKSSDDLLVVSSARTTPTPLRSLETKPRVSSDPPPILQSQASTVVLNRYASVDAATEPHAAAPVEGLVSCRHLTHDQDPNHGRLYARHLISSPHYWVAVHSQQYDPVRWKSIYVKGAYYEQAVHEHFVTILQASNPESKDVVLDVGMNIGYYSLLAASLGAHVVSFEINPLNILRMCESLRLNDLLDHESADTTATSTPRVEIYQRGVAEVDQNVLPIHIPKSNPGQASLVRTSATKNEPAATATTTTITLDSYAQHQGWLDTAGSVTTPLPTIAILKIDVEGLEPNVLLGAQRLLQARLIRNVLTEFRDLDSPVAKQAWTALMQAGYRLVETSRTNRHALTVLSLDETKLYWTRFQTAPLWYDFDKTPYQKFKAWVTRTPVVDLWFTLDDEETLRHQDNARRSAAATAL